MTWRIQTLKRKTDAPNHVGSGDWLGSVVMAMPPMPDKSKARKYQQRTSDAQWPIEISVIKLRVSEWDGEHETNSHILHPEGESEAKDADNCCDDVWFFCFHIIVMCANDA